MSQQEKVEAMMRRDFSASALSTMEDLLPSRGQDQYQDDEMYQEEDEYGNEEIPSSPRYIVDGEMYKSRDEAELQRSQGSATRSRNRNDVGQASGRQAAIEAFLFQEQEEQEEQEEQDTSWTSPAKNIVSPQRTRDDARKQPLHKGYGYQRPARNVRVVPRGSGGKGNEEVESLAIERSTSMEEFLAIEKLASGNNKARANPDVHRGPAVDHNKRPGREQGRQGSPAMSTNDPLADIRNTYGDEEDEWNYDTRSPPGGYEGSPAYSSKEALYGLDVKRSDPYYNDQSYEDGMEKSDFEFMRSSRGSPRDNPHQRGDTRLSPPQPIPRPAAASRRGEKGGSGAKWKKDSESLREHVKAARAKTPERGLRA